VNIEVRLARPQGLKDVLGVLDEAAAWLQTIGLQQWPESYSRDPALVRLAHDLIDKQEMFIACDGDAAVGCFRLSFEENAYWPGGGTACYLFSLAVRRSYAGQGVGQLMLDSAAHFGADRGCAELRLDCFAGNQKLRDYYANAGFEWRGDIEVVSAENSVAVPQQNRGRPYYLSLFARRLIADS
jgi:GNAT superfamily N-acetyltransferase